MSGNLEKRRAELLEAKAERLRARDVEAVELEVQGLELEAKYEETLGPIGIAFAMVDATAHGQGFIVLKLGEDLAFRKYLDAAATADGLPDAAEIASFVNPCVVYPDAETYAGIVRSRGFIANRCSEALGALHGIQQKKIAGKF